HRGPGQVVIAGRCQRDGADAQVAQTLGSPVVAFKLLLDRSRLGGTQGSVHVANQHLVGQRHGDPYTPQALLSRGWASSSGRSSARPRASRARASRDITVPTGTSSIPAASS